MKKWFLALLTTLMALMLSVASAENVPLASETEINPVLEAQTLVGLKIPVEAFKETTKGGEVISAEITTSETDAEVQYVNVFGYIYPVDESAPNIEWRMLLPMKWNGRSVQLGSAANRLPITCSFACGARFFRRRSMRAMTRKSIRIPMVSSTRIP